MEPHPSHIHWPAAGEAPAFDRSGELLVEAILKNLWEEGELSKRRLADPEFWKGIKKGAGDRDSFPVRARGEIKARMEGQAKFYMLFKDAERKAQKNEDRDTSWKVAKDAIRKALPGLRVVRLTRLTDDASEYDFVPLVRAVRDCK